MAKQNVLIAMSGGVDSSVTAYLMQESGFDCAGGMMLLCSDHDPTDARSVSSKLGMPFHVLDCREDFDRFVVEPFIRCYEQGGTPNPCIQCNRHLKFDIFLEKARQLGYESIATGHYAQVRQDPDSGRYLLYRAADKSKDQSYFLACLTQDQLSHVHFPLGALTKEETRQIAAQQGFSNANKRDSQDICFIPDGDYKAFMERYSGKEYPAGDYLDKTGKTVGKHAGAVGYTIGQRKGLGIALGEPVYVCAKDMDANTVTLGTNEDLFHTTLRANSWNWIAFGELSQPIQVMAKVRYRHTEQPATVYPEADGFARVEFAQPQRAITTGQAVVLYDGDKVIGGGTITEVIK